MIGVSTLNDDDKQDGERESTAPEDPQLIESYETDECVVFYDAYNPLAWVETSRPLTLDECA
ncbi:DUF7331 family protein [Natrarchaeobaculum sulfurireducens]|uniref:Uncharacterized protein n=1 Tax=Natrarchaeobaculum sulfurireducens TaxID=2044521 RepID=A0A346PNR6_9EURY|nr:hypothetical protein [Natrarchaeobaculum sulfurireducens]AXR78792.1 hypothetical protein AArc1_2477 [Natrarchaeobaculum sulfurireducens]AXR81161.1 hypothetical protein AArcMg_1145 [Natrarchaeobaculum sulfurireducens]